MLQYCQTHHAETVDITLGGELGVVREEVSRQVGLGAVDSHLLLGDVRVLPRQGAPRRLLRQVEIGNLRLHELIQQNVGTTGSNRRNVRKGPVASKIKNLALMEVGLGFGSASNKT